MQRVKLGIEEVVSSRTQKKSFRILEVDNEDVIKTKNFVEELILGKGINTLKKKPIAKVSLFF